MTSHLKNLKAFLLENKVQGFDLLNFETSLFSKEDLKQEFSHTERCPDVKGLDPNLSKSVSFNELLTLKNPHACLDAAYLYSKHSNHGFFLGDILSSLEIIFEQRPWAEIKTLRSLKEARVLANTLNTVLEFREDLYNRDIRFYFDAWLHSNRGYPKDPSAILEAYADEISNVSSKAVPAIIAKRANSNSYVTLFSRIDVFGFAKVTAKRAAELYKESLESPDRKLVFFHPSERVSNFLTIDVTTMVLRAEINKLNPLKGKLISIPRILYAVYHQELTRFGPLEVASINWTPGPEQIMTASMLVEQGLTLQQAITSVEKLA